MHRGDGRLGRLVEHGGAEIVGECAGVLFVEAVPFPRLPTLRPHRLVVDRHAKVGQALDHVTVAQLLCGLDARQAAVVLDLREQVLGRAAHIGVDVFRAGEQREARGAGVGGVPQRDLESAGLRLRLAEGAAGGGHRGSDLLRGLCAVPMRLVLRPDPGAGIAIVMGDKQPQYLPGAKRMFRTMEPKAPEPNPELERGLAGASFSSGGNVGSSGSLHTTYTFGDDGSVRRQTIMSGSTGGADVGGDWDARGRYRAVGKIVYLQFRDGQQVARAEGPAAQPTGLRLGDQVYRRR